MIRDWEKDSRKQRRVILFDDGPYDNLGKSKALRWCQRRRLIARKPLVCSVAP